MMELQNSKTWNKKFLCALKVPLVASMLESMLTGGEVVRKGGLPARAGAGYNNMDHMV